MPDTRTDDVAPRVDRINAELADVLPVLREWCALRAIPFADWPRYPAAHPFVELATSRAVRLALRQGRARSWTHAMQLVCGDFGIRAEAVLRRLQRARKEKRQSVAHTAGATS